MNHSEALELLTHGELEVAGRIVDASNATLLAHVTSAEGSAACVYKPVAGERPLWDFPRNTLALREAAAFVVSEAGGFDVVPPTVLRDGPFGPGSVQLWVEPPGQHEPVEPGAGLVDVVPPSRVPKGWLRVLDAYGTDGEPVTLVHADDPALALMAVFDVVTNNADRKGGHVLRDPSRHVVGVDHGLTFHAEPKLRTVLWGWAGQPLPAAAAGPLATLDAVLDAGPLPAVLAELLSRSEVRGLQDRVVRLREEDCFPLPDDDRPPVPWPPF